MRLQRAFSRKEGSYILLFLLLLYDHHIYISISARSDVVVVGIYARGGLICISNLVAHSVAINAALSRIR